MNTYCSHASLNGCAHIPTGKDKHLIRSVHLIPSNIYLIGSMLCLELSVFHPIKSGSGRVSEDFNA